MRHYRIYYNHKEGWPQVWCVDEGTIETQIKVKGVLIETKSETKHAFDTKGKPFNRGNEPTAWIEVNAVILLDKGVAVFST